MFEIFGVIFTIAPLVASIIAAVYAYKAYELVKLERDIRIAREKAEQNESKEA